jgi:hypothetical protein
MKIKKSNDEPLNFELSHGSSNGTTGSFGLAVPLNNDSNAQRKGDTMLVVKYRNTGLRIVVGDIK